MQLLNARTILRLSPFLLFVLTLMCSHASYAQSLSPNAAASTVVGFVHDEMSQRPITGAVVRFTSAQTDMSVRTDVSGRFEARVQPGRYVVTASASGYKVTIQKSLSVGDQAVDMDISLAAIEEYKLIGHVNVTSTAGSINTTPMAITRISSDDITAQGPVGIGRILSEIPGVSVTAIGSGNSQLYSEYAINSPATPVTIAIRGSQPYENATLFDGHRINSNEEFSGVSGAYDFATLDPYSISALDVVRGPGAESPTINNAIGGVVNVDPGTPQGQPSIQFSTGFDGQGGEDLHVIASGESKNKRLGLGMTISSVDSPGPIYGTFDLSGFGSELYLGQINGVQIACIYGTSCFNQTLLTPNHVVGYAVTSQD